MENLHSNQLRMENSKMQNLWIHVDRKSLRIKLSEMLGNDYNSALAVIGCLSEGLITAGHVVEAFFISNGYQVVRVAESVDYQIDTRHLFVDAWKQLDPPTESNQIPRSYAMGSALDSSEIIDQLVTIIGSRSNNRIAFLFDTVDSNGPLHRPTARLFVELSNRTKKPVVILSNSDSASHFTPGFDTHILIKMSVKDVIKSLKKDPVFSHVPKPAIRSIQDDLRQFEADGTLTAQNIYEYVEVAFYE